MGLGSGGAANAVYVISVMRAVPGHRQLLLDTTRRDPASKVRAGSVVLQHVEGGAWTFATITRYDSWQDFAADRMPGAGSQGADWATVRQHMDFHRDSIADRLP